MSLILQIKRGLSTALNLAGTVLGELKFTTDNKRLYIGDGTNNIAIGGQDSVFLDETQTLKNKTISTTYNTILGIDNSNFKSVTAQDEGKVYKVNSSGNWILEHIKEFKVVQTFLGETGNNYTLYILTEDVEVSGVSYKQGFYTWDASSGFVARSGIVEVDNSTIGFNASSQLEVKDGGLELGKLENQGLSNIGKFLIVGDDGSITLFDAGDASTRNYNLLDNKPSVNNRVLAGNKSSNDLGLLGIEESQVIKNKTIDSTQNNISNLIVANFDEDAISTDIPTTTAADATDTKLPTEKAVLVAIDRKMASIFNIQGGKATEAEILALTGSTDMEAWICEENSSIYYWKNNKWNSVAVTNLDPYQKKEDSSLQTTAKRIVDAINEVNAKSVYGNDQSALLSTLNTEKFNIVKAKIFDFNGITNLFLNISLKTPKTEISNTGYASPMIKLPPTGYTYPSNISMQVLTPAGVRINRRQWSQFFLPAGYRLNFNAIDVEDNKDFIGYVVLDDTKITLANNVIIINEIEYPYGACSAEFRTDLADAVTNNWLQPISYKTQRSDFDTAFGNSSMEFFVSYNSSVAQTSYIKNTLTYDDGSKYINKAAIRNKVFNIQSWMPKVVEAYTYTPVASPSQSQLANYYEIDGTLHTPNSHYIKTTDTSIVSGKTYYTRSGSISNITTYSKSGYEVIGAEESETINLAYGETKTVYIAKTKDDHGNNIYVDNGTPGTFGDQTGRILYDANGVAVSSATGLGQMHSVIPVTVSINEDYIYWSILNAAGCQVNTEAEMASYGLSNTLIEQDLLAAVSEVADGGIAKCPNGFMGSYDIQETNYEATQTTANGYISGHDICIADSQAVYGIIVSTTF